MRRQTPATVCVPTQPVAAALCRAAPRLWCAIGNGRLGGTGSCAAARVLHSGARSVRPTGPWRTKRSLTARACLTSCTVGTPRTPDRPWGIRRPCTRAALAAVPEVRVERARDSSLVPVQEAALVPLKACKATASHRVAPARHTPTLERAYDCAHRGSTSASHRPRDLPHAPVPHDPRQDTLQLTTCTITRASADVRMRACRAQKVSVLCR